jgi:hypothetical protein
MHPLVYFGLQILDLFHEFANSLNKFGGCWVGVQVDAGGRAIVSARRISHFSDIQVYAKCRESRFSYSVY